MTLEQLLKIMPYARPRAGIFLAPLNAAMTEFFINTKARQAAFLSQIGHESGHLQFTHELASGAAYDTGALAQRLGNTPTADGDGQRWKGHGLIQVTGLGNHQACATYFGIALDRIAAWLETPEGACRSAGWFWHTKGLNQLADAGDQVRVTRRVNGGINGLAERLTLFDVAVRVLS
ncbi:glycoside hydrolase family 19 protein [Janthinobacterium sp. CG3]|uniref:glycoside hydrolase family 19 protein n=1 Tax=Janthinobacterium sp. CG3 TaxID=1075768 RepID=UPI00056511EE|nr:glycoside hydrolase family 19 protein [Janthinobacterium sp. CG3]